MGLFKHIYKSTRFSHLLLGIVAFCAFSSVYGSANQSETKSISVQQTAHFYQLAHQHSVLRQTLQHFYPSKTKFSLGLQAVTFIPFFVKKYQHLETKANPIRAGPTFLYQ